MIGGILWEESSNPKHSGKQLGEKKDSKKAAQNQRLLSAFWPVWSYHLRNATVAWKPRIITWYRYPGTLAAALNYFLVTPPRETAAGNVAAIMPATQIAGAGSWAVSCDSLLFLRELTLGALPPPSPGGKTHRGVILVMVPSCKPLIV